MKRQTQAGRLDKRVTVRRCVDSAQGAFGIVRSHDDELHCWARVDNVRPGVYHGSVQSGDTVTHEITLRARKGRVFGPQWEVVQGKRVYRVKRLLDPDPLFTVLLCEELNHGA